MQKEFQLRIFPQDALNPDLLKKIVCRKFKIVENEINHITILRRSIDARKQPVKINLKIRVFLKEKFHNEDQTMPMYRIVRKS